MTPSTSKSAAAGHDPHVLLEDPEDFHRRRVLLYYIMTLIDRGLSRLNRRVPQNACRSVPYIRLFTSSLILTCLTLLPLLVFHFNIPDTIWFHLYLGLVLFVQLWSVEFVNRTLLCALLPPDGIQYRSRQFWESLSVRYRYQALPGLICALFAAIFAPILFRELFSESPGLPLYLAFILQGFLFGAGGFAFIVGAARFVRNIDSRYFMLYPFDPRRSPIVGRISRIFEATLWAFGTNLVVMLLPLLFMPRTPLLLLTALIVSIMGFGLLANIFILAQQRLTALVRGQKEQTLLDIQRRIVMLYQTTEKLDKAAYEDLQNLMKLHDQIANAGEWGISATGLWRYGRTLVLPAITAVYANRELIMAIYKLVRV